LQPSSAALLALAVVALGVAVARVVALATVFVVGLQVAAPAVPSVGAAVGSPLRAVLAITVDALAFYIGIAPIAAPATVVEVGFEVYALAVAVLVPGRAAGRLRHPCTSVYIHAFE
jgi:hypothetical protein